MVDHRLELPTRFEGLPELDPRGSLFFVGTATVILRCGGFTILTDPNFLHRGDHVHLGYGLTAERLTDPAIELEDLPQLDFVLLSHLHEDHFDRLVQERLDRDLPIVTTPASARALRRMGFRKPLALDTWDTLTVNRGAHSIRLTAMPGKHGPGLAAAILPPVMGTLVELDAPRGVGRPFRIYITGDTIMHGALREIPRRYPGIDLMLIHLGGTRVLGILVTMDARQGVEMVRLIAPRQAIPIHYDDYDRFKSPLADFLREVEAAGLAHAVHPLQRGESFEFELRPSAVEHRDRP